nr:S8 family serine peptidase [Haloarchaeobius sp. HME9146]
MGRFGTAVVGRFPEQALAGLARHPGVRYVAPDAEVHAVGEVTPWGIDAIGATAAHDAGKTGVGSHVAILDTGIDPDHQDLQANLGEGVNYSDDPDGDGNGHGTHVSGTVAAVMNNGLDVVGVAPSATLHAVKVLGDSGSGSFSDIIAGIDWVTGKAATDWGAHTTVINMSLGAKLHPRRLYASTIQAICESCQSAWEAGVVVVAAAGNDDDDADKHYPSACDSVIAVAATDSNNQRAWFSNYGSTVELAGPGVGVLSTVPPELNDGKTTASYSGTSMASPHVAGAAAQLLATGAYTNASARQRLRDTATDLGSAGWDQYYGYGLVNVADALGLGDGGGGGEDSTGPTFDAGPTATDTVDDDGTTGDFAVDAGDTVRVEATVSDASGVASVVADASAFGGPGSLDMIDDGTGTYAGEFVVGATGSVTVAVGESATIPVTATDASAGANTTTAQTNALTVEDNSGGGGTGDPTVSIGQVWNENTKNPHAQLRVEYYSENAAFVELTVTRDDTGETKSWTDTAPTSGQTETSPSGVFDFHKGQGSSYTVAASTDGSGSDTVTFQS